MEETLFYPTGGGQPHDLGTINGVPVIDVFEEDGKVVHVLPQPLQGDRAFCVLDWERRLDHMQQHSGQHLLSAVFEDKYGFRTESFHLGEEYCTIDISAPALSVREQNAVEERANQVIFANLPLLTYTIRPEEKVPFPSAKFRTSKDLRIVEIKGFDYSPCSGTHVSSTGQIGLLKVIKWEKYKGMTTCTFSAAGALPGLHANMKSAQVWSASWRYLKQNSRSVPLWSWSARLNWKNRWKR